MTEKKAKGGHAGPMVLENTARELQQYGREVERHRKAVEEMGRKPMSERIAALKKAMEAASL